MGENERAVGGEWGNGKQREGIGEMGGRRGGRQLGGEWWGNGELNGGNEMVKGGNGREWGQWGQQWGEIM